MEEVIKGTIITLICEEQYKQDCLNRLIKLIENKTYQKESIDLQISVVSGRDINIYINILAGRKINIEEKFEKGHLRIEHIKTNDHFQETIRYLMNNFSSNILL